MKTLFTQLNRGLLISITCLILFFLVAPTAHASVSVTPATGGSSISADTVASGVSTALTGPVVTEGALGDIGTGTIILTLPSGFVFDTTSSVKATVTNGTCSGGTAKPLLLNAASSQTVTPGTTSVSMTVTQKSSGAAGCIATLTYSGIKVKPSSGTSLASGNIVKSGTAAISGTTGSTNFGTLNEVPGVKNKMLITTQPGASATSNTNFSPDPVVEIEDQYGNTLTNDNASTISTTVLGSTQSCGNTSNVTGTLTSTPSSGAVVSGGVTTYTMMKYSKADNIKICFTSSGLTSVLSGAINVKNATILAASSVTDTYGNTVSLSATLTSNGAGVNGKSISFSVNGKSFGNVNTNASGVATVSGVVLNGTNGIDAATYASGISVSFGGDTSYNSSSDTSSLTVAKRPITVTAATNSKTYDGTTSASAIPTITSGSLVAGDTSSFTEVYTNSDVGLSRTLTPSGSVNDGNTGKNYTITFVSVNTGIILSRAITVTAVTNSKTYDGTTSASAKPTITSGSLAAGDTSSFTETYSTSIVGTGQTLIPSGVVSDGNSGNNYVYTYVNNTSGTITAATLTYTATPVSRQYGQPNSTLGGSLSGLKGSDTQSNSTTGTLTFTTTAIQTSVPGTYAINGSGLTVKNTNYSGTIAQASGNSSAFTITKADQVITFASIPDKNYGDPDFSVSATSGSGLAVSLSSRTATICTITGSTVHLLISGTCTIRAAQSGNTNYNAALNVDQSFDITKSSPALYPSSSGSFDDWSVVGTTNYITAVGSSDATDATYIDTANAPVTHTFKPTSISSTLISSTMSIKSVKLFVVARGTVPDGVLYPVVEKDSNKVVVGPAWNLTTSYATYSYVFPTTGDSKTWTQAEVINWTNGFGFRALGNSPAPRVTQMWLEVEYAPTSSCQLGIDLSWDGGTTWVNEKKVTLGGGDATYLFGGSTDLWGRTAWFPSEFSTSTLRVRAHAIAPASNCSANDIVNLDWLRLNVSYTGSAARQAALDASDAAKRAGVNIFNIYYNSTFSATAANFSAELSSGDVSYPGHENGSDNDPYATVVLGKAITKSPIASLAPNQWTTPNNALSSKSSTNYATDKVNADMQGYGEFTFGLPPASTVSNTQVIFHAKASSASAGCSVGAELSRDGGLTFTSTGTKTSTITKSNTDASYTLSFSPTQLAGWSSIDFSPSSFVVRIQNNCASGTTLSVNRLQTKLTYSAIAENSDDDNFFIAPSASDMPAIFDYIGGEVCPAARPTQNVGVSSAGTLILITRMISDNSGDKDLSDFTLSVSPSGQSTQTFPASGAPGTTVTVPPGTYSVSEGAVSGYTEVLGDGCYADSSNPIVAGETRVCFITNDDIPPPPDLTISTGSWQETPSGN